ncbi:hypothetical protein O181_087463 [Austropuccinia psidii MF-1]|uniref:Uncharacterized protein n=1 Tax=Austropuccinia psidii MF-1 TaxID=1389203 RepID=A0A9Q3IPQ6_9BASI|nr:hypothetical protein [Austropuccinia psidii MF-1]
MLVSTCAKKAADDNTKAKPLLNEEVCALLNSLKSACSSYFAKMHSLQMALSSPPLPVLRSTSSAYEPFMQEPYHAANRFDCFQGNGASFSEWVAFLNRVLCIAFNSEMSVDDSPSLLDNHSPQENREISHFINMSIPPDFALCIGIVSSCTFSKKIFEAIKAQCCPGSCFEKLKVVWDLLQMLVENASGNPKSNTSIVISI